MIPLEETPKLKQNLSKTSEKNPESASKIVTYPRFYALKILKKNEINSEHGIRQAKSERDILESMDHPFVVKLHYAFQTKSRLFLIVDLLAGVLSR
jgi:serine/threonine protein kinase